MSQSHCLNCGKEVSDRYCSGCGQKTDTHRITIKNFIFHDVLHGTFHLEKGIFFTAKEALVRPGKAALDYIAGKRIKYYNVFLLILITIGVTLFVKHFYDASLVHQGRGYIRDVSGLNEASRKIDDILSQKSKIVIFLFVPLAALNSFVLFRRKKLNLSEHTIIAGMILLGILLLSLLGTLLFYPNLFAPYSDGLSDAIRIFIISTIFIFIGYGYVNAFGSDYGFFGLSYRLLLFYLLIFFEIFLLFLVTFGILTDWKFGEVVISVFD